MGKKIFAAVSLLLLLPAVSQESGPGGSGFADLNGNVIHYEYFEFGGFQLYMSESGLKWRGVGGEFDGVVAMVTPQVSKVNDDIYFMSWPTPGEGGDNVVMNFDAMTVNAHLGGGERFRLITGVVHCRNSSDCVAPEGDVMSMAETMQRLMANAQRSGRMPPGGMGGMGGMGGPPQLPPAGPLSDADKAAREALRGKVLQYPTDSGMTRVAVADDTTMVSVSGGAATSHSTHATQIADGVLFVSWGGPHGGNHIVFNAETMKVYDQILADGTRKEAIYDVTCFGVSGSC